MLQRILRFIFIDIIGEFLMAPVWWYSRGLLKILILAKNKLSDHEEKVGLKIWADSLFLPMYAQRDWQGRLISFFMRFVLLFIKSLMMVFWLVWYGVAILFWLVFPVAVAWQIFQQLRNPLFPP